MDFIFDLLARAAFRLGLRSIIHAMPAQWGAWRWVIVFAVVAAAAAAVWYFFIRRRGGVMGMPSFRRGKRRF
jgi:hypothetical protein